MDEKGEEVCRLSGKLKSVQSELAQMGQREEESGKQMNSLHSQINTLQQLKVNISEVSSKYPMA